MAKKGALKRKLSLQNYGGRFFLQICEKGAILKISLGNPALKQNTLKFEIENITKQHIINGKSIKTCIFELKTIKFIK